MKVTISNAKPGSILAEDLYDQTGRLLLPKGTELDEMNIYMLRKHHIMEIEIEVASRQIELERIRQFQATYEASVDMLKQIVDQAKTSGKIPIEPLIDISTILLEEILQDTGIVHQLSRVRNQDEYTFRHLMNVSIYSGMLAKWLGLTKQEQMKLALAGILHDCGKIFVPNHILNKQGALTDEEQEEMKKHTEYGYQFLMNNKISEEIALVALNHHERRDGTGYPKGIRDRHIDFFSRVVAVADVYDAMCSDRTYQKANSPYHVSEILWELSYDKMDPQIVLPFIHGICQFFVGDQVVLNTGETAKVVFVYNDEPTRPLVQLGNVYMDLRKHRQIKIEKIL
ncbi:HD-GYP domain-containing protein [Microaerobacter geothermalis]|uniref:HD-GYP domain-containing protein n=1 Tax=Microaerobacter geothermalis TaxID=674972 RepID=UPI001F262212|nr:HD-GYP domain-containing protein [Microaerobacter geothermalis]MCF6093563.1 HD-GYP domain-containing protein [Microaerobacter geothermalis]